MEDKTVVKLFRDELFEVCNCDGSYLGIKLNYDFSVILNVDKDKIGLGLGDLFTAGSK